MFTENPQNINGKLTEHSQKTHRIFIENTQTIHRKQTECAQNTIQNVPRKITKYA